MTYPHTRHNSASHSASPFHVPRIRNTSNCPQECHSHEDVADDTVSGRNWCSNHSRAKCLLTSGQGDSQRPLHAEIITDALSATVLHYSPSPPPPSQRGSRHLSSFRCEDESKDESHAERDLSSLDICSIEGSSPMLFLLF